MPALKPSPAASEAPAPRPHFQLASSGDNKRSRTRALLLDTAISVFARKGIDAGSILEITAEAGLSNGGFYYHFPDKAALVHAVGRAIAATLVRETDAAMADLTKGHERVAFGSQFFIRRAAADPTWGRLIVRALADQGEFREQISAGIRKDVGIGIEQGHFDVEPSPTLYAMLLGIVSAALEQRLNHADPSSVDPLATQALLRVLGVRPAAARTLALRAAERIGAATGR